MKTIRRIFLILWRTSYISLEIFVGFLMTFWSIAMILSAIGTRSEKVPEPGETRVYITSNGVHTDVVVPLNNKHINWVSELQLPDSLLQDSIRTHAAIGWGDKGFFLETKNWGDLKASVALRAAFHLGHSAMHIVQVREPDPKDPMVIQLDLTREQYDRLVTFVIRSFEKKNNTYQPITEHPYGKYNYFFEANRSYGLTYTCNSWTNSALKSCGQRACVWTPLRDGIYAQYEKL